MSGHIATCVDCSSVKGVAIGECIIHQDNLAVENSQEEWKDRMLRPGAAGQQNVSAQGQPVSRTFLPRDSRSAERFS
jgi:hypothetical protein